MCGIAGVFAYRDSAPAVDREELLRVREYMRRRGPDGEGLWLSDGGRIGLAHRRLAIIDLTPSGAQPMWNAERSLCATFNGEIYNFRALRKELEAKGCRFQSSSDTEVLLQLYADRGAQMVHALRGMYAFGIWDERNRSLFLARDPFGIKPLYYADDGETLRFASQVKALLAGGRVDSAPEPAGSAGFLLWGSVPEPFTLYRGIHALPAGSHLTLKAGGAPSVSAYFSVHDELARAQEQARDFRGDDRDALAALLHDSVRHHLVSDVPVAVFLSAGVDSSVVSSFAAEEQRDGLRALTLGFEEYRGTANDEVPVAQATAAAVGIRQETDWIKRSDFGVEFDNILAAMDQPSIDGVNAYFVCRAAARAGIKVALSGLGGDEFFGGYPGFRDVPRLARWLGPARYLRPAGRLARIAAAPLLAYFTSPKFAGVLEYGGSYEGAYLLRRALFMPWELGQVLDPASVHVGLERLRTLPLLQADHHGLRAPHAKVSALETTWYMRNQLLRDADWAGMAHSVEVRVPLVDVALFRALAPWLASTSPPAKSDLAGTPRVALRREVADRPKTGFSVPVREWLATAAASSPENARGLRGWARRVLPRQPEQFRALLLVSDAFGGHGGIAKFNRDLAGALAGMPECAEVVVVPRIAAEITEPLPSRVRFLAGAAGSKLGFAWSALMAARDGPFDLVISGHINLVPLGACVGWAKAARTSMVVHGIDAWNRHANWLVRACIPGMDCVIGVSKVTLERFGRWAGADRKRFRLVPNCVDLERFSPGPKPQELARRFGLEGRTVIMTLGRLASDERYKGFDEVIEAIPALARTVPDISYFICGDGSDRARLERKAATMGVGDRVVFAGHIPEATKLEHYRMADAYVMPSYGEGFGIVLLEALACGLPVLGSAADGSREALMDGKLGELVDPSNAAELLQGILRTLGREKGVPEGLRQFSTGAFRDRVASLAREALGHP